MTRDPFLFFLFSFVWSLLTKACTWGTSPATSTKIAVMCHDFHLSLEARYTLNPLSPNGKQMINGAQFGIGSSDKNWIDTWLYQKYLLNQLSWSPRLSSWWFWTNRFEKYAHQNIGSFPEGSGWHFLKKCLSYYHRGLGVWCAKFMRPTDSWETLTWAQT